jgi:hypothetical protein
MDCAFILSEVAMAIRKLKGRLIVLGVAVFLCANAVLAAAVVYAALGDCIGGTIKDYKYWWCKDAGDCEEKGKCYTPSDGPYNCPPMCPYYSPIEVIKYGYCYSSPNENDTCAWCSGHFTCMEVTYFTSIHAPTKMCQDPQM